MTLLGLLSQVESILLPLGLFQSPRFLLAFYLLSTLLSILISEPPAHFLAFLNNAVGRIQQVCYYNENQMASRYVVVVFSGPE